MYSDINGWIRVILKYNPFGNDFQGKKEKRGATKPTFENVKMCSYLPKSFNVV